MAKLNISVRDVNGQTVSHFGLNANDHVVFYNNASQLLEVSIQSEPGAGDALCKGSQPVQSFTVLAAKSEGFKVCGSYNADTFKYTATIQGSQPEDPIIIIERSNIFSGDVSVVVVAVTAVATFAVGAAVGAAWARSRSPAS